MKQIQIPELIVTVLICSFVSATSFALDCNGNGIEDSIDIENQTSQDCNSDGIPDECALSVPGFVVAEGISTLGLSIRHLETLDLNSDGNLDVLASSPELNALIPFYGDGQGQLETVDPIEVGIDPVQFKFADFNLDGILDVAAVTEEFRQLGGSLYVSVIYGKEDGTFELHETLESEVLGTEDLTIGDFNEDGWPDISTPNFLTDNIAVFLSDGEGGYLLPDYYDSPGDPRTIISGDFNGDGRADIATANIESRNILVYINNGDGSFAEASIFPSRSTPSDLAAEDFDNDNILDFVTANRSESNISFLKGNGDGTFARAEKISIPDDGSSLSIGDFDANGTPDVLINSPGEGSFNLLLTTDFGFTDQAFAFPGGGRGPFISGDFNQDSLLDIVFSNSQINARLYVPREVPPSDCNSNGTLDSCDIEEGTSLDLDQDGVPDDCQVPPSFVSDCNGDGISDFEEIEAGANDCDQNGVPDSCQTQRSGLLLQSAQHLVAPDHLESFESPWATVVSDFNGDGVHDIASVNYRGASVFIFLGQGDRQYEFHQEMEAGFRSLDITSGDVNGDGNVDLIISNQEEARLETFINDGEGNFGESVITGLDYVPWELEWADLDKDGSGELIVSVRFGPPDGGIDLLKPDTEGVFTSIARYPSGNRTVRFQLGDVDNDGLTDILVPGSGLVVFHNEGDLNFREGSTAGGGDQFVLGDFVEDGNLDIISVGRNGAWIKEGNGDGTFITAREFYPDTYFTGVQVADLDEDTHLDLILTLDDSDELLLLYGDGLGKFLRTQSIIAGSLPFNILPIDIDGDGLLDLVTANSAGSSVSIIYGNAPGHFESGKILNTTYRSFDRPQAIAISERSIDGKYDLFFARSESRGDALAHWKWIPGRGIVEQPDVPIFDGASNVDVADFNNDGRSDLRVQIRQNSRQAIFLQSEAGEYEFLEFLTVNYEELISPINKIAIGDLDSDSDLDLVEVYRNAFVLYFNEGDGSFSDGRNIVLRASLDGIQIKDFTGDGLVDLASTDDGEGNVIVIPSTSPGIFGRAQVTRLPDGARPTDLAALHMDEDGILDLAVINKVTPGTLTILKGRGDGKFNFIEKKTFGGGLLRVKGEYLNGDSLTDLVVTTQVMSELYILEGSHQNYLEDPKSIQVGSGMNHFVFCDFDGNHTPEILGFVKHEDVLLQTLVHLDNLTPYYRPDCDEDGVLDYCQIQSDSNLDLDQNGELDTCQEDCNQNGILDLFEIQEGLVEDCNQNGFPDSCDIDLGISTDFNSNLIPDDCDADCDSDGRPDDYEIENGEQADCDGDGVPDDCELSSGEESDVDQNGIPDSCQDDCDGNGLPDAYEISNGNVTDCNENGLPDNCDILSGGFEVDKDGDGILDECEADCDEDGVPDDFEILNELETDCNLNGVIDRCEIASGEADCNENGVLDSCELLKLGNEVDRNSNQVLDECEGGLHVPGDCNQDAVLDISDGICLMGHLFLGKPNQLPCSQASQEYSQGSITLMDWQGDLAVDLTDAIALISHIFLGTRPHELNLNSADTSCFLIIDCSSNQECQE